MSCRYYFNVYPQKGFPDVAKKSFRSTTSRQNESITRKFCEGSSFFLLDSCLTIF